MSDLADTQMANTASFEAAATGSTRAGRIPTSPKTIGLFFLHTAASMAAVAAWWFIAIGTRACSLLVFDGQLAGTGERFTDASRRRDCTISGFHDALWADLIFDGILLLLLAAALAVWWNSSWDSEPGYSRIDGRVFGGVAGGSDPRGDR